MPKAPDGRTGERRRDAGDCAVAAQGLAPARSSAAGSRCCTGYDSGLLFPVLFSISGTAASNLRAQTR